MFQLFLAGGQGFETVVDGFVQEQIAVAVAVAVVVAASANRVRTTVGDAIDRRRSADVARCGRSAAHAQNGAGRKAHRRRVGQKHFG